jgi:hypothetical protein
VRFVLFIIPVGIYDEIWFLPVLQMSMDLFPELLFFSTYLMLLFVWAEMYHFSKAIKESDAIVRRLWIAYAVINATVYFTGFLVALLYGRKGPLTRMNFLVEALFLSSLSVALVLAFPIYGILLFKTLSKAAISSNRKKEMVKKLLRLLIICLLCFVTHIVYLLLVDNIFLPLFGPKDWDGYPWIWCGYFVSTEVLPICLILNMMRRLNEPKKSSRALLSRHEDSPAEDPYYQKVAPGPSSAMIPERFQ